jgi:hypothetical protein
MKLKPDNAYTEPWDELWELEDALPPPRTRVALSLPILYYDAKNKDLPLLTGLGIPLDRIIITNALDRRCAKWAVGRDIKSLIDATMLAHLLCPEPPPNVKDEGFFRNSAIRLLKGVIEYFLYNAPGQWDFRDLVQAFESVETVKALLTSDPRTRKYAEGLGTDGTSANVLATVVATIYEYDIIAALYDQASMEFSLRDWLHGDPSVLVLGFNHEAKTTLNAMNRALFTMASKLILNLPTSRCPRVVVCLDEVTQLGRLEGLKDIATLGREQGAVLILGFQSIDDLKHTYGSEIAETILGQINHKGILRLSENNSATWASSLFGKVVRLKHRFSFHWRTWCFGLLSFGQRGGGNLQEVVEDLVMPAELMSIPPVDWKAKQGLTGYYITQYRHAHTYPIAFLQEALAQPDATVSEFEPAPASWQVLRPWDETDFARLHFTPPNALAGLVDDAPSPWLLNGSTGAPPATKNGAAIQPEGVPLDFLTQLDSPSRSRSQPAKGKDKAKDKEPSKRTRQSPRSQEHDWR